MLAASSCVNISLDERNGWQAPAWGKQQLSHQSRQSAVSVSQSRTVSCHGMFLAGQFAAFPTSQSPIDKEKWGRILGRQLAMSAPGWSEEYKICQNIKSEQVSSDFSHWWIFPPKTQMQDFYSGFSSSLCGLGWGGVGVMLLPLCCPELRVFFFSGRTSLRLSKPSCLNSCLRSIRKKCAPKCEWLTVFSYVPF